MPNEAPSMEDYAAQREASPAPAPDAPALSPAAPSAQDPANSGPADLQQPTADDPAAAPPQQPDTPQQQEQRRNRGVQKRLDELTRARADAERRADMLLELGNGAGIDCPVA